MPGLYPVHSVDIKTQGFLLKIAASLGTAKAQGFSSSALHCHQRQNCEGMCCYVVVLSVTLFLSSKFQAPRILDVSAVTFHLY